MNANQGQEDTCDIINVEYLVLTADCVRLTKYCTFVTSWSRLSHIRFRGFYACLAARRHLSFNNKGPGMMGTFILAHERLR